jgi:hypothetical protein
MPPEPGAESASDPGPGPGITFDGQDLPALPGQTVAAVLTAAGVRSWRRTRNGSRPRGLFCGIGICYDCLLTLNGTPNVRACVATVRPGDRVESQEGTGREPRRG